GGGTLANAGTVAVAAGGSLGFNSGGLAQFATTLANTATGVLDLQADAALFDNFNGGTVSGGTLRRSTGGTAISKILPGVAVAGTNLVDVQQGTLLIGASSMTAAAAGTT